MPVSAGEKFGRLTARINGAKALDKVEFRCKCGAVKSIRVAHVTSGRTVSCGCVKRAHTVEAGQKFGRLTVQAGPLQRVGEHLKAPVRCECGVEKLVGVAELVKGGTKSCGCLVIEQVSKLSLKHGGEGSPLYSVWHGMKTRCGNSKSENFSNYGGRGIRVCAAWADDFGAFRDWAEANGYRPGLEIDRTEVNGNYEPDNCRWTTSMVNGNNRRNNVRLQAFGEEKTMSDWARDPRCAVTYITLKQRIRKGTYATAEDAIATPVRG